MAVILDELITKPVAWLSVEKDSGIVISSRVRLARNISGFAFPEWADEDDRISLYNKLCDAFKDSAVMTDSLFFDMNHINTMDKDILMERHIISSDLAEKGAGSGVIVSKNERIAIMINEEDHIRFQTINPGMDLFAAWKKIDVIDSALEDYLDYAFSPTFGYLTACPSNVGTGLRASVMMHLSGLRLINEIEQVVKGLEQIGLAVRGLLGEGTEAYGDMFQISNQVTMGETEKTIIDRLTYIVSEVARHEYNARVRLMENKSIYVRDQVSRALGLLTYARVLPSKEAVDLLSCLRLGIDLGIIKGLAIDKLNEIMLLTQPGHLQKIIGKVLGQDERDEARAEIVQQKLKNISMVK